MADAVVVPKRTGGSLTIVLPAEVVRQEGIEEGKPIHITVRRASLRTAGEAFGKLKGKMPKYTPRGEEGIFDV